MDNLIQINNISLGSLADTLKIEILQNKKNNKFVFKMPVNGNTQPFGKLSGGASAALAETVGSFAANYYASKNNKIAVGIELNISHVNSNNDDYVFAYYNEIKAGRTLTIHEILIKNPDDSIVSVARISNFLIENKK